MSIGDMISANVRCTLCGSKGVGSCDCWVKCEGCGCYYESCKICTRCDLARANELPRAIAVGRLPASIVTKKRQKAKRGKR